MDPHVQLTVWTEADGAELDVDGDGWDFRRIPKKSSDHASLHVHRAPLEDFQQIQQPARHLEDTDAWVKHLSLGALEIIVFLDKEDNDAYEEQAEATAEVEA